MTAYACENEHYDVLVRKTNDGFEGVLKLNIGGIKHTAGTVKLESGKAKLIMTADNFGYNFCVCQNGVTTHLGYGISKYLSSEVVEGFTGTMLGLFAVNGKSEFENFEIIYK